MDQPLTLTLSPQGRGDWTNTLPVSFAAICDWTFLRSLALALLAWPVCVVIECGLKASSRRMMYLSLVVGPFLFPELLLGYLIAPFAVGRPWRAELACDVILLFRAVPVGVLTLWISPPSAMSRAALYLARLSRRGFIDLLRYYWQGPIRRALPAVGLMFLVMFQEFEAAALLGAVSWTDRLFTEHAQGLSLTDSLRYLARPLAMQLAVLAVIAMSLFRRHPAGDAVDQEAESVSPATIAAAKLISAGWFVLGVIVPMVLLSRDLTSGWTWLVNRPEAVTNLIVELSTAALVGLVTGLLAWNLAFLALRGSNPLNIAMLSLPGLCGGLTISLGLLHVSTWSVFRPLSATPVWWTLAATVWLLPRALLLHAWLAAHAEPASLHLVSMLRETPHAGQRRWASQQWWQWRVEPQIAAVAVLCYWAYLDLTSASLLDPPGMASVVKRLYNFMHYGHSAAMTMEATVAMLAPALAWGTILIAARVLRGSVR